MRLTSSKAKITKNTVDRLLGIPCRVWLFGSRAHDIRRGGDIDLMVETEEILDNRADTVCGLYGALIMALGDRKLDIVLKDARTGVAPIFKIAKRTCVML